MSAADKIHETSLKSAKTPCSELPNHLPVLSATIRQASLERFAYISGLKDLQIVEVANWDAFSYGTQLALIMIAGKDLKLFFKAHFRVKPSLATFGDDKNRAGLFDLYREFCNLTAGAIKQTLQSKDVLCGISLPTVISGYDELILSDTVRTDRMVDCFVIGNDKFSFTITVLVDVSDPDLRVRLESLTASSAASDDIDFL